MKRSHAFFLLACLASAALAQNDPAYVDGPAGRAVSDPARADGGSIAPGFTTVASAPAQPLIQQQMLAAAAQQQAAMLAAQQQAGLPGTQPGAAGTPIQQIGAGLMQDAGGMVDAGIQRQINGGNVVVPMPQQGGQMYGAPSGLFPGNPVQPPPSDQTDGW